ncbi:hypothetical protein GQ53DRAFT_167309 [Thozetella sp. PMI_491]|nr:hypothetical protein GQ53DRAFT_167309 [Thozetella sp. PMI_491]
MLVGHEMSGSTLTMAPAVEASTPFHRSHSTPNLLGGMPTPQPSNIGSLALNQHRNLNLKSLPSLPAFDVPSFDFESDFRVPLKLDRKTETVKVSQNEKTVEVRTGSPRPAATAAAGGAGKTVQEKEKASRRMSMIDRPRSWLPSSKSTPNVQRLLDDEPKELPKLYKVNDVSDKDFASKPLERSRTVESFAEFARRSWISTSRSPSPPSSRHDKSEKSGGGRRASLGIPKSKSNLGSRKPIESDVSTKPDLNPSEAGRPADSQSPSSTTRALNRASIYLTKFKQSPQNVFASRSFSLPLSASSAPKGADSDNIPSTAPSAGGAIDAAPELIPIADKTESLVVQVSAPSSNPRNSSHTTSSAASDTTADPSENASESTVDTGLTMPHPTSNDPHWGMFRNLDDELPVLASKTSSSARMAVVRATLVPFLRSTALHPSNTDKGVLSPEDVERRTSILNKWWNELLKMLDGSQGRLGQMSNGGFLDAGQAMASSPVQQPVAGVDRPTLLEATTLIMMRPEWRMCTSYFQPLKRRSPGEKVRARSWTQSTAGDEPDMVAFIIESAEHNVRTMFVNNLVRQMALVVEKMSQRHAPTSLVNWCGKACAYAFFFVPGIADILVRLWGVNNELLRRTAEELGLPKVNKGESEDIVALFPPSLGKLGWSSVRAMEKRLRTVGKMPLITAQVPWTGPWVSRWRGADTDLLFIFTKYYYILSEEFMPSELPLVEKARAPAFVLLHAQLLSSLDATIHRHETLENWSVMESADAVALPLPGNNLLKEMDENRLIILLKDMLADSTVGPTISEAFVAIMRGAAKKTSIYNTSACCVMLDFFEQLLALKVPIDLWFWLETLKPILTRSENSLTEIKLITFLYSVWDEITADPAMKESICCNWLLSDEIWNKFFNNWCSLTRSYYMRLVCWRMCRDSGTANQLDSRIFLLVSQRLKTTWSHYLWLRNNARAPPSTVPSLPAPSKRFIIIRSEVVQPQPGLLMPFDSFPSPAPDSTQGPFFGGLVGRDEPESASSSKSDPNQTTYKKRWSLLGKVLSMSAGAPVNLGSTGSSSGSGKRTWEEELEQARRETAASRSRGGSGNLPLPSGPPPPPKAADSKGSSVSDDSSLSSPVFEAAQYIFRFGLQPYNFQTKAIILAPPRLPAPAQARVSSARAALSNSTGSGGGNSSRSASPPPIAAGLPPPTRRFSGLMSTGLVSEARNARPLDAAPAKSDKRASNGPMVRTTSNGSKASSSSETDTDEDTPFHTPPEELPEDVFSPVTAASSSATAPGPAFDFEHEIRQHQSMVQATEPTGIYTFNATYTGRALAEWSIVVNENNSFVDRRRDEGVLGLASIEVPTLSMEGLGFRGMRG